MMRLQRPQRNVSEPPPALRRAEAGLPVFAMTHRSSRGFL
jgi:hypothetical protein